MSQLADRARPAVVKLAESETPQLFEELGLRLKAIAADERIAASFDLEVGYDATLMGPMDDVRAFGRSFFERASRQAYGMICGGGLSKEEQAKVTAAFGNKGDLAALLAAFLVSHFAMAPAIAAVVGALVLRLFFRPAHEAMCEVWSKHIQPTPG